MGVINRFINKVPMPPIQGTEEDMSSECITNDDIRTYEVMTCMERKCKPCTPGQESAV